MIKVNKTSNTNKKFITNLFTYLLIQLFTFLPAFAFEDVIITNNSKLTDIKIENHEIIDVFPLITIMNDKNTIIVHPLKEGESKFSVMKDKKNVKFSVKVDNEKTIVSQEDGFDILAIDCPPTPEIYEYELDEPPVFD